MNCEARNSAPAGIGAMASSVALSGGVEAVSVLPAAGGVAAVELPAGVVASSCGVCTVRDVVGVIAKHLWPSQEHVAGAREQRGGPCAREYALLVVTSSIFLGRAVQGSVTTEGGGWARSVRLRYTAVTMHGCDCLPTTIAKDAL